MRLGIHAVTFAIAACLAIGCGDTTDSTTAPSNATTQSSGGQAAMETAAAATNDFVPQRPQTEYTDPRMAVHDFLTSVKNGDDATATSLLSTAAQQEAWRNGMAISADGFPDANFEVSEIEYLNNDTEAHVMSVWSDVSPDGETKAFRCVWLLNHESHGWCVYGMATKFLDSMDPVVLNFENQDEMMKRQRWAEEQIAQHRLQQQEREAPLEGSTVQQATHTTEGTQQR